MSEAGVILRDLGAIAEGEGPVFGGKAFRLGLLLQAGLNVPRGFAVSGPTADALRPEGWPDPLREAIRDALLALGGPVAVRSSAAMEDGAAASFAGQGETALWVDGHPAFLEAFGKVAASLSGARAAAYREAMGGGPAAPEKGDRHLFRDEASFCPKKVSVPSRMTVLVQRMVKAEVSGVLFTRDPVTGRDVIVVEAHPGDGDSLLGGRVDPERYLVDPATGRFLSCELPEGRPRPSLREQDGRRLRDLARLVRERFKDEGEQDIEWCLAGGLLHCLQARPITTLGRQPAGPGSGFRVLGSGKDPANFGPTTHNPELTTGPGQSAISILREEVERLRRAYPEPGAVLSSYTVGEILSHAAPLSLDLLRDIVSVGGGYGRALRRMGHWPDPALGEGTLVEEAAGSPYLDLARLGRAYFGGFPFGFDEAELFADPRKAQDPVPRFFWERARGPRHWFRSLWVLVQSGRIGARARNLSHDLPGQLSGTLLPEFDRRFAEARAADLGALAPAAALSLLRREWEDFARESIQLVLLPAMLANFVAGELRALLKAEFPDDHEERLASLSGGVEDPSAFDLADRLFRVAEEKLSLEDFLEQSGHRAVNEFDLFRPRWREDPDGIRRMAEKIRGTEPPAERAARERARRKATEESCRARLSSLKRPNFDDLLDAFQGLLPHREIPKHRVTAQLAFLREILLALGRASGMGDAVFFLRKEDLDRPADFEAAARERRARWEALRGFAPPPALFSRDFEALLRGAGEGTVGEELRGTAASAGRATGRAVCIRDGSFPEELGPGDVLVAPAADPGLTPLLLRAAALVTERGGILSHGAVVAREAGIPAVLGVPMATRRIPHNARVTVDGSRGVVTIVSE